MKLKPSQEILGLKWNEINKKEKEKKQTNFTFKKKKKLGIFKRSFLKK